MKVRNPPSAGSGRFRPGLVLSLATGHFVHDLYTAFLSPLLPLLIRKLSLSLTEAGSLTMFLQLPTVMNPFLGSWVDRHGFIRPLVVLGPTATGVTMCLIGVAPTYAALCILLLVGGLSVAALHVAAPVAMADAAGHRIGLGMSFHMLGGEIARTVGPLLAVQAVSWWSLTGIWRLIPLGVAASAALWWRLGRLASRPPREQPTHLISVWSRMRRVLLAVLGIMMARAFLSAAITSLLPTFLVQVQSTSLWFATLALVAVEAAGAAGVLSAGAISDRFGRRGVLLAAVALAPPLLVLFLHAEPWLRVPVLMALGFLTLSTTPVLMAFTIENAGADRAAANGTFIMIAFSLRALAVPLVGVLGDLMGLQNAFLIAAGLAALGLPFVFLVTTRKPGNKTGAP